MLTRPAITLALTLALAGCKATQQGFDAPSPDARLDAIVEANAEQDITALQNLIRQLDSTDPAARMLAIRTLESLTGQTLGYEHAAPDWQREPAIERWVDWYNQRTGDTMDVAGREGGDNP